MADFIYTSGGTPQGFRRSSFIYAMDGSPIGRVFAEKAYRLDGTYVGVLINNMVVDRPNVSRRSLASEPAPPMETPPRNMESRRPVAERFPDCFSDLVAAGDP